MLRGTFPSYPVIFLTGLILAISSVSSDPKKMPSIIDIQSLDYGEAELMKLRGEIADNLRSVIRSGKPAHELRFLKYHVKEKDNFFKIMAKASLNEDTLSSFNDIIHPNDLAVGDELLFPNIRGIFLRGKPDRIGKKHSIETGSMIAFDDGYVLPGRRFPLLERRLFRGDLFRLPLKTGRLSSNFGYRRDPFNDHRTFHGGVDIAASTGTRVYASRRGRVIRAGTAGGYGKLVVIEHDHGYQTYYGHLSRIDVKKGDIVDAGKWIGLVGSTGRATGPHLHFEVRKKGVRKRPRFIGNSL